MGTRSTEIAVSIFGSNRSTLDSCTRVSPIMAIWPMTDTVVPIRMDYCPELSAVGCCVINPMREYPADDSVPMTSITVP